MAKSIRKRRTLITSPLAWQMTADPVAPPMIPVIAERGGTQLKTPRPVLVVNTQGADPIGLFAFWRLVCWNREEGSEAGGLFDCRPGGYLRRGAEGPFRFGSFLYDGWRVFINRLRRMAKYPHRLLADHVHAEPNQITVLALRWQSEPYYAVADCCSGWAEIPFLCSETHDLGEEIIAWPLIFTKFNLYHWLENE